MELTCKVMQTKAETGPGSLWDQAPFCCSHLSSPSSLSHPDFSLSLVQKLEYGKHTASTFMFPQQVQIPERNILTGLAFSGPWSYQLWPGRWGHVGFFICSVAVYSVHTSCQILGAGDTALKTPHCLKKSSRQENNC